MRWLLFLALISCTQKPIEPTALVDKPATVVLDKPDVSPEVIYPLSWEKGHPERKAWSDQARLTAGVVLRSLEKAKDINRFCPKYFDHGVFDRVQFWGELVSTMAFFESAWNPKTVFKEPAPLNNESIGLLQLSQSDAKNYASIAQCKPLAVRSNLMDPLINLDCGLRIMAQWIAKDGAITTPNNLGAARYWSVLREKRKLPDVLKKLKGLKVCS